MSAASDEWLRISHNMRTYGGGFARMLGELMLVADSSNRERIRQAWPELLEKYAASHWDFFEPR